MVQARQQAVTGVVPPQVAEARIREAYPSVAGSPALAGLGLMLTKTIVLAPLGWLLMSAAYFGKLLPFFMTRYTLTNRRLMIRKGWGGKVGKEVALGEIDDVRLVADGNTAFFRAANLEVVAKDQVVLTLAGVPEADAFRVAILNCRNAWAPGMAKTLPFLPASAAK